MGALSASRPGQGRAEVSTPPAGGAFRVTPRRAARAALPRNSSPPNGLMVYGDTCSAWRDAARRGGAPAALALGPTTVRSATPRPEAAVWVASPAGPACPGQTSPLQGWPFAVPEYRPHLARITARLAFPRGKTADLLPLGANPLTQVPGARLPGLPGHAGGEGSAAAADSLSPRRAPCSSLLAQSPAPSSRCMEMAGSIRGRPVGLRWASGGPLTRGPRRPARTCGQRGASTRQGEARA